MMDAATLQLLDTVTMVSEAHKARANKAEAQLQQLRERIEQLPRYIALSSPPITPTRDCVRLADVLAILNSQQGEK